MSRAPASLPSRLLAAAAATLAVAALAGAAWYGFDSIASQPIRHVVVAGDTGRIAPSDLEAFARGVAASGAAGSGSLAAVREAARRIPWVREATVRRVFPDAVEVAFETHVALARRDDGSLVSVRGEVFNAEYAGNLPRFSGPEGAAATMTREYPAIRAAVAPLDAAVKELRLTPRGAWQVALEMSADRPLPSSPPSAIGSLPQRGPRGEGELVLELGRGDVGARLARFVAAWPQLAPEARATRHADLRYANGFALEREKTKPR
jgi:cell division protein FtsQ